MASARSAVRCTGDPGVTPGRRGSCIACVLHGAVSVAVPLSGKQPRGTPQCLGGLLERCQSWLAMARPVPPAQWIERALKAGDLPYASEVQWIVRQHLLDLTAVRFPAAASLSAEVSPAAPFAGL